MSGGLPYGLQSMLKVRETTRRDETETETEWMDGWDARGTRDGWMTRWGRDDEDERWLEGERGTGGWETIGSGVCRRAWGGKTASERTRRRG